MTQDTNLPSHPDEGPQPLDAHALAQKLEALSRAHTRMGWTVTGVGAAVFIIAMIFFFWPPSAQEAARLAAIEAEAKAARQEALSVRAWVPKDWQERMDTVSAEAKNAAASAKTLSEQAVAQGQEALSVRLQDLEGQVRSLGGGKALNAFLSRINALSAMQGGEIQLDAMIGQLAYALRNPDSASLGIDALLARARDSSALLSQTFVGVADEDLKAAALLLTMTQVRSALARDDTPFAEDLSLLKSLLGSQDPTLAAAIDRLAPQAETGVLTPQGLLRELQTLTGDVVEASLRGEDVNLSERATAQFHDIMQIERNGVPVTGTPVQGALLNAQTRLEAGDVTGAQSVLSQIDGPAAEVLAPLLRKMEATSSAQDLEHLLEALAEGEMGSGKLIQDEASGIAIYERPVLPRILKP